MSRVVRSSKYRHVFGTPAKKEDCFDEVRITRSAWDSNYVAANPKYIAVILEAAGGGAFQVLGHNQTGKVHPNQAIISGHKGAVLDVDWNPFNDGLVASVSEDCTGKIWGIPEGGLTANLSEPLQTLNGHKRKVGTVLFNQVAANILATSASDFAVKVWDIEKGKDVLSVEAQHTDIISSVDWNHNGSLLVTACKDKKVRVVDPRQNKVVADAEAHGGIKGSRVAWLNGDRFISAGFSKTSEREVALWDAKDLSKPLMRQNIDSASGLLCPFFDRDTGVLFLAGKGDGNIRYFEIVDEAPYMHYLSEYKSNTPLRGLSFLPKRAVNVSECEIARGFKVQVKTVEPISFQVPRKSDIFQPDLFPDCFSGEPALTADQWLGGENADPKTASLESGFVAKPQTQVEFKPAATPETTLSEKELRAEYEKLVKKVAYLEAELVKKDAKIKELENK